MSIIDHPALLSARSETNSSKPGKQFYTQDFYQAWHSLSGLLHLFVANPHNDGRHIIINAAAFKALMGMPELHKQLDQVTKHELLMRGYLGRIGNVHVFTDVYARADKRFMGSSAIPVFIIVPDDQRITFNAELA